MKIAARLFRGRVKAGDMDTPGYQAHRDEMSKGIPTWWRHDCGVNHRSYRTFAKCILGTDEVNGEGAWAILPCWKDCGYSVHLYQTELSARNAAGAIDDTACGCRDHGHTRGGGHRIIRLGMPQK